MRNEELVKEAKNLISENRLWEDLEALCRWERFSGTEGEWEAAQYIQTQPEEEDILTTMHNSILISVCPRKQALRSSSLRNYLSLVRRIASGHRRKLPVWKERRFLSARKANRRNRWMARWPSSMEWYLPICFANWRAQGPSPRYMRTSAKLSTSLRSLQFGGRPLPKSLIGFLKPPWPPSPEALPRPSSRPCGTGGRSASGFGQ